MPQENWNILMVVLSTVAPDVRVEKEARYLASEGHTVTVIGTNPKGNLDNKEQRDGYTILRVPSSKKLFFKYFEFWKNVKNLVGKNQYDIIHLHDLNVLPLATRLKKNAKILVYDSHENFPEQMSETFGFLGLWGYSWVERYYIKRVQGVVTAGITYSENLKRKYKVESSWIANYPSRKDVEAAHKKDIPKEYTTDKKFKVVHFGVMYHNLGYDKTIEAAKILSEKFKPTELEFLVMGSGTSLEPMEQLIEKYNLSEYFNVTGWMNYLDALSIMRSCDVGLILFQPGKNNFLRIPNRLYEYCSAGIPFIGSNFEGLQRATLGIDDLGILIDPTSPQEIADAIVILMQDYERLENMKKTASEIYKNKFNWETEIVKLEEQYKKIFLKLKEN
ncbi:MAG: glycosyltransferase family 4 protein [Candidatus Heimdallarchaeota archaeon]|nr:glycosyltransferase family 4 protein [Candidatus Heimdallarchaeota archaeon]MCK5144764.1 glycosyltransferase family 4 protein [Candidatus Heimdallarchaeota archaeon]